MCCCFWQKKLSRLAFIETEGNMYIGSDQDSVSCDNEVRSKDDDAISDDESEIVDLMKRVELMKKERSVLWLREFKEWMDLASDSFADGNKHGPVLDSSTENYMKKKASQRQLGESSRYVSGSVQASGNESGTSIMESDNSFAYMSMGSVPQCFDLSSETYTFALRDTSVDCVPVNAKDPFPNALTAQGTTTDANGTPLTVIDDIIESHLSSDCPGSPPHYQEDLLHRRHILVEDILQLSAESFSVASSDSNTSDSDDLCENESLASEVDQLAMEEFSNRSVDGHVLTTSFDNISYEQRQQISQVRENGRYMLDLHVEQASAALKLLKPEQSLQLCSNIFSIAAHDGEIDCLLNKEADWLNKKKCKRRQKRIVSLSHGNVVGDAEGSQTIVGTPDVCEGDMKGEKEQIFGWDFSVEFVDGKQTGASADDFIKNYFDLKLADSSINETCKRYAWSSCLLELESRYTER